MTEQSKREVWFYRAKDDRRLVSVERCGNSYRVRTSSNPVTLTGAQLLAKYEPCEPFLAEEAAAQQEEQGKVERRHREDANFALTGVLPEPGWPVANWVETGDQMALHPTDLGPRVRIAQALSDAEARGRSGADGGWVSAVELANAVTEMLALVSWSDCGAPVRAQVHAVRKLLDRVPLPAPPSAKAEE